MIILPACTRLHGTHNKDEKATCVTVSGECNVDWMISKYNSALRSSVFLVSSEDGEKKATSGPT